jgi:hypothetical protein
VDGSVAVSGVTGVVHIDDNASTISVDDGGGSLTVDGTVGVSGTVTVDSELTTADLDTGAGTDTRAVVGLAGAASGGAVLVQATAAGAIKSDLTTIAGTAVDVNSGTKSAGTQRVVLATDQPNLTTALNANVSQMNGVATTMGNGVSGTGVQRVSIASDSTGNIATIGTSITPGTAAANLGKAEDAAAANGDTGVLIFAVRRDTPSSDVSAVGDYATLQVDANGAQWVKQPQQTVRIQVNSAGLTTVTTSYTSGDQLGTELTFAGAASITGWGGVIVGATLIDKALKVNTGDVELWLFNAASTPASDNAAADWSDANILNLEGIIKFATADWRTNASNAVNNQQNLAIGYGCAATSLFGSLVTRQANGVFSAVTDLTVILHVVRD